MTCYFFIYISLTSLKKKTVLKEHYFFLQENNKFPVFSDTDILYRRRFLGVSTGSNVTSFLKLKKCSNLIVLFCNSIIEINK